MSLPKELISQFAKVTHDDKKTKKESIVYGTIVTKDKENYLHIDGAYDESGNEILQPLNSTVATASGDRVIVSIRNHSAVVTGNLTTPSTTVEYVTVVETQITNTLEAEYAKIESLDANWVSTERLESEYINADAIEAEYAKLEEAQAKYAEFDTMKSDYGAFKTTYTEDLKATNADIKDLEADTAHVNELMFGSATGEVMQTSFANAVIALLGNAAIKSAMIESLDASKINAGTISTDKVTLASDDGSLSIFDNLIQIKDGSNVRIQIGKDASGNYSIVICDSNGATMLDVNGITENAIKDAIIRNDMVAEDANISGSKIDIDSLITEINENGSTTIKSSKIYLDTEKQTLGAAFTELSDEVQSQGTAISTVQGKIESKIWKQDIISSGRNILSNSGFVGVEDEITATYSNVYDSDDRSITHTSSAFNTSELIRIDLTEYGRANLRGSKMTISGEYRVNSTLTKGTTNHYIGIEFTVWRTTASGGTNQYLVGGTNYSDVWNNNAIGKWIKFSKTHDITDYEVRDAALQIVFRDLTGSATFRNLKVEFGDKVTGWTSAPEDLDANVDTLSTKYSSLEQNLDGFKTTVSETYATASDVENIKIGGRNLATGTTDQWAERAVGSWSGTLNHTINGVDSYQHTYEEYGVSVGDYLTFGVDISAVGKVCFIRVDYYKDDGSASALNGNPILPGETGRSILTVKILDGYDGLRVYIGSNGTVSEGITQLYKCFKVERGTKPTDWTPAPEDVNENIATEFTDIDSRLTVAETVSEDNVARLLVTESRIEQLSNMISQLVTDGRGTSLMTQTSGGWTFSTINIQNAVDKVSREMSDLMNEVDDSQAAVDILQKAVSDLGVMAEYIKIGTYEDEPCIELGEGDSNFKLLITNTRIMFMDGSDIPAYINNKSLHIKKAVIEEELHQGGFAWVNRSNGHLSLVWKGAAN